MLPLGANSFLLEKTLFRRDLVCKKANKMFFFFSVFELEFYGPVKTVMVMLSKSFNQHTLFLGQA